MTYQKFSPLTGRIDGTSADVLRWHQVIKYIDLNNEKISLTKNCKGFVFLAFSTDEGVRRNQGRVGASQGHQSIAQVMANLPMHFDNLELFHGGVILCEDENLEKAQAELAFYVEKILVAGCTPIVLGGGHDVTYGHYSGLHNFINKSKKIGIINIDAHFDLRPIDPAIGATSGTSIWQIATEAKKHNHHFNCLALGVQKYGNTKLLFNEAENFGVKYIFGDDFNYDEKQNISKKIADFINEVDHVYLTVCMDVFAACYAPGVSATAYNGIVPDYIFMTAFDQIVQSKKFVAIDFAELNPKYDIDFRTAKLAASMIFRLCK
jgi:formiminoglutamase